MAQPKPDPTGGAPYGTVPRRSMWLLWVLIPIFLAWFAFLISLAVRFPAHP